MRDLQRLAAGGRATRAGRAGRGARRATSASARSRCGAQIIGVNNRNLRTLEVDLEASHVIARSLPDDVVAVSESGLKTPDDLRVDAALGYHAFLIGERFM